MAPAEMGSDIGNQRIQLIMATAWVPIMAMAVDKVTHIALWGGAIVSSQHSNRAKHTLSLEASHFDVIHLAKWDYHIGMDSVKHLTNELIQDCGYSCIKAFVKDVVVCYNGIIVVHHKVYELWYNAYAHTSGPQVNKILHKLLLVFPRL